MAADFQRDVEDVWRNTARADPFYLQPVAHHIDEMDAVGRRGVAAGVQSVGLNDGVGLPGYGYIGGPGGGAGGQYPVAGVCPAPDRRNPAVIAGGSSHREHRVAPVLPGDWLGDG